MKKQQKWSSWQRLLGVVQLFLFISLIVLLIFKWTSASMVDDLLALSLFAAILSLSFVESYLTYRARFE